MPKQFHPADADGGRLRQYIRTRGRMILIDTRRVQTDANVISTYESGIDMLIDQMEAMSLDASDPDQYFTFLRGEIRRIEREFRKGDKSNA